MRCVIRLRGLQEVLPLTLSSAAGSSAPVSLAASLRLPPQAASPVAAGSGPARPSLPPAADARVLALTSGLAWSPPQRPVVRINGLLVPDGLTPAVDDGQEAQELGAALGYMTLFLHLAAAYLGSPLLHQARVAPACTSSMCCQYAPRWVFVPPCLPPDVRLTEASRSSARACIIRGAMLRLS